MPDVLISGDHKEILRWRRKEALRRTLLRRPGMLGEAMLSDDDNKLLSEIKEEER